MTDTQPPDQETWSMPPGADFPPDVSPRMVELARQIDHLPNDGDYLIRLRKTRYDWSIVIERAETVRVWRMER